MQKEEIRKIVCKILSNVLERDIALFDIVTRKEEENWDSLKHVEILFSLEEAFNIQFTEQELTEIDSLEKIITIIGDHIET